MTHDLSVVHTRFQVLVQLTRTPGADLQMLAEEIIGLVPLSASGRRVWVRMAVGDLPDAVRTRLLASVIDAVDEGWLLEHILEGYTEIFVTESKRNPAHARQVWNALAGKLRAYGHSTSHWIEWPLALSGDAATAEAILETMLDVAQTWK